MTEIIVTKLHSDWYQIEVRGRGIKPFQTNAGRREMKKLISENKSENCQLNELAEKILAEPTPPPLEVTSPKNLKKEWWQFWK